MRTLLIPLLALVVGLGVGAAGYYRFGPKLYKVNDWIEMTPERARDTGRRGTISTAVGLSFEEFDGDQDIGPPAIEDVTGKGKFVLLADGKAHLGYLMHIKLKPTDLSKVPDKYKHDRPVKNSSLKEMALVNASYEVDFTFTCLDKDGFKLQQIHTKSTSIRAGQNNRIQAESDDVIEPVTIAKVASISWELGILKNNSLITDE